MEIVKKLFKILKIFETSSQNKNKKERVRDNYLQGELIWSISHQKQLRQEDNRRTGKKYSNPKFLIH